MAKLYLEKLSAMVDWATSGAFKNVNIECKHFFSGAALYANNRICISLTPVGLALKLPEELKNSLLKNNEAKPLRYFPKGPIKKDYVVLSEALAAKDKVVNKRIRESIKYVLTLPDPKKKKRKGMI